MNSQYTAPETIAQEQAIVMELTGWDADQVVFNDAGWDSRVYADAANHFFFKFPRSPKIQGRYAQEIAALKLAAQAGKAADIAVPIVEWEHHANEYFGYRGVKGEPLSKRIAELDDAAKQALGHKLGLFLKAFHQFELPDARHIAVADEVHQLQEWYERGAQAGQQLFAPAERQKLRRLVYEVWPVELEVVGIEPALCHGDLHFPNIMVDDKQRAGLIDFGDVGYYDRSKDFNDLGDPVVYESALGAYGDSAELRHKIQLRKSVAEVITLTFHLGKQNRQGIDEAAARIRQTVAA